MPGRVIFLVVFALLLSACSDTESPKENTVVPLVSKTLVSELDTFYGGNELMCLSETKEATFKKFFREFKKDTSEAINIKPFSDAVQRVRDSLVISFANGSKKVYADEPFTEMIDDFVQYTYYGKLKDIGYHVLFVGAYESFSYLLVNEKNGKETYMCGIPVVSPNKKYLAATCYDLDAGFVFNGVQMYDAGSDSLVPVWKRELSKWGADEMAWMDDHSLVIKKRQYDTARQNLVSSFIKLSCCGK
jgi:hypothetical protein